MSIKARLDRQPAGADVGSPRLRIELIGTYAIFRFLVNVLGHQVEFATMAELKLRALRRQVGGDRLDRYALMLLGSDRYDRLRGCWSGRSERALGEDRPAPAVETITPAGGVL